MAKTKKNDGVEFTEEIEIPSDNTPIVEQNATNTIEPVELFKAPVKTRKVMGLVNHKCRIGTFEYIIEKNKDISVPNDVAMILQRSGKVIVR